MPEKNGSEVQKKMLQFQILEGNLKSVRGQLQEVLVRAEELSRTKIALEELANVKPGEAFVPVGAGTFVRGRIMDPENVLVSIGSDMAVSKTRKEAVAFIDEHLADLKKAAEEMAVQERVVVTELQKLQPELERMLRGQ